MSVVPLSQVIGGTDLRRIDSSFFARAGLTAEATLRGMSHATIASLASSIISFGAYALTNEIAYQEEGVPFLRCRNIKNGFISFADALYIDEVGHALLHKSQVVPETVLLSMSGSVGNAAVALPSWQYPVNSNQDIAKIRANGIDPYYMTAFLGSRFGQAQMQRLPVGSVQQHIFLSMIETILIARLSDRLEGTISALMREAYATRERAETVMADAENILLSALGLRDWSPPEPLSFTRTAAEVLRAGRLDSEFASPKVQALLYRLGEDGATLSDYACARHEKFKPAESGEFKYIEIGDLDGFGRAAGSIVTMAEAPSRATWHVRTGDVITSTVRPIRRLSAIVSSEQDNDVCSSGFVVLRPTGMSSESLVTYLRLPLICRLLDLFATASMYPALSEGDLMALPVPLIADDADIAVTDAVRRSRHLLRASERLLDAAKQAIEIAIERDEVAAIAFIAEQREAVDAAAL